MEKIFDATWIILRPSAYKEAAARCSTAYSSTIRDRWESPIWSISATPSDLVCRCWRRGWHALYTRSSPGCSSAQAARRSRDCMTGWWSIGRRLAAVEWSPPGPELPGLPQYDPLLLILRHDSQGAVGSRRFPRIRRQVASQRHVRVTLEPSARRTTHDSWLPSWSPGLRRTDLQPIAWPLSNDRLRPA